MVGSDGLTYARIEFVIGLGVCSTDCSRPSTSATGLIVVLLLLSSSVAIGNPEWHVRKALHRGSKQQ